MIDNRVLFVVGAGASTEFGLPTGRSLLTQLSQIASRASAYDGLNVKMPEDLRNALMHDAQQRNTFNWGDEFQKMCSVALWISRNAPLAPSIDNLLHSHRADTDITRVGKLMIAYCLINAESNSSIAPSSSDSEDPFAFLKRSISISKEGQSRRITGSDSWISRLFWLLAEESSFEDFLNKLSNIDFVCFNYDRCIEHYLVNASISYFRISDAQAERVLNAIKIVHPYGSLGDLRIHRGKAIGFGEKCDLRSVADRIRTFTEGTGQEGLHEDVKQRLQSAKFILFLGFGFLSLNIELIFGEDPIFEPVEVAATSLGLSETSTRLISEHLNKKHKLGRERARKAGGPMNVGNLNTRFLPSGCSQILDHYHHFLRKL